MKKLLIIFILVCLVLLFLPGCSKQYTVAFVSENQSINKTFFSGEVITYPEEITKQDYGLIGWYLDSEYKTIYTETYVNKNLKLYAKWKHNFLEIDDDGLIKFKEYLFEGVSLSIPEIINGKKVIGLQSECFSQTKSLKTVIIPEGVTIIGNYSFIKSSVESIVFPESLASVGVAAFYDSEWLKNQPENEVIYAGKIAVAYKGSSTNEYNIEIKPGTKAIAPLTFANEKNLAAIKLPDTLRIIGESAFFGCEKLKAIDLPESLLEIQQQAFFKCVSLKSINLPSSLIAIGAGAFAKCENLKKIVLPPLIKVIESTTFSECKNLIEVTLNEGLEIINYSAFYFCGLKEINLPKSLMHIKESVFMYCDNLEKIIVNRDAASGITKIEHTSFYIKDDWQGKIYIKTDSILTYGADFYWNKFFSSFIAF